MREVDNWKITHNDATLGQVLTLLNGRNSRKIIKTALDGSVYIQTIGEAGHNATVSALCSRTQLVRLQNSESMAHLITVRYRDTIYYGFIEEPPEVETNVPGEWYTVSFVLRVDSVGTVSGGIL